MILATDSTTNQFIEILSSWSNPLLLTFFFIIIIFLVLFFINRHLIKPLEQKHTLEKKEIEYKNSRMMALFAELDPDPVIRVDVDGKVNLFNEAASRLLSITKDISVPEAIFKISQKELGEMIASDSTRSFHLERNGVYYNVLLKCDSALNIAQFYLRDISVIKNLEIKLKQLSNHLQDQLDEERFRIAHELHDGIAQELYLVQLGLRNMSDSKSLDQINIIKSQVESATEELRRIIYDLKPKVLDEMGLEPAIRTLCNNVSVESGIAGSIQVIGLRERLDKKLEIYFYRIIQEAVSNVVKHSGATEYSVIVSKDSKLIRTIISDNGCGLKSNYEQSTKTGFGILNMKERTEGFGGVFKIESIENEGLTLITEIPI
jgi:signal transduction histidine kinase